jgi:NADH:ubiquinone oxidoreductase subunit 2 (subunit N)
VIQAIYFKEPVEGINDTINATPGYKWLLIITAAIIILLGVVPGLVIDWIYY